MNMREVVIIAAWRRALSVAANGLDLTTGEDRSTFRARVSDLGESSRHHVLVTVLADLEPETSAKVSNAAALRQIADAYIAKEN